MVNKWSQCGKVNYIVNITERKSEISYSIKKWEGGFFFLSLTVPIKDSFFSHCWQELFSNGTASVQNILRNHSDYETELSSHVFAQTNLTDLMKLG